MRAIGTDEPAIAIGDSFVLREKINDLQAARHRRQEEIERLQEKLRAANNELTARREELDTYKGILHEERAKNKDRRHSFRPTAPPAEAVSLEQRLALQMRGHRQDDRATRREMEERVRLCIEEQLLEMSMRRSRRNELGIRRFDEKELMVEKPLVEQAREASNIDTVLIEYIPNVENRYSATYRVDKDMTVKKLQEDACLYWGLPEVEYVLRTVENSKLHDQVAIQNCFRKDEQAILVLVRKSIRQHVLTEDERLAIRGNKDRRRRTADAKKALEVKEEEAGVSTKGFFQQMAAAVPGTYEFMTQRDQRAVEHLSEIRLRNLLLYLAWAVLTIISIAVVIPPDVEYYVAFGNKGALTAERVLTTSSGTQVRIPEFQAIRTPDQVWDWLTYSVSGELLVSGSSLRQENYIPGWLQVRMQHVREANADDCGRGTVDNLPAGVQCLAVLYTPTTAGTDVFPEVESYWEGDSAGNMTQTGVTGLDGRDPRSKPWQYSSTSDGGVYDARYQEFDSSGYYVNYNLQHRSLQDTYQAYLNDTAVLREAGWISGRTRSVSVEFTTYNGNTDYWVTSKYLFEMPPAGFVVPLADVIVYKPLLIDGGTGLALLAVDVIRAALCLYLIAFQIPAGVRHALGKREVRESLLWRVAQHLSLWVDVCVVGLFLAVVIIREVVLPLQSPTAVEYTSDLGSGFVDTRPVGKLYRVQVVLEAFLLAALLWRVMTLCRINRHVYLLWKTMAVTLRLSIRFFWVLLPMLAGFVLWGHVLFGEQLAEHRTVWSSFVSVILLLYGNYSLSDDVDRQRPIFSVYFSCLYVFTHLVFVNVWIASLLSAYQRVRVTSGYRPEDYSWKEWQYAKWCLAPRLRTLYHTHLRPHILCEQDDEAEDAGLKGSRVLDR